MSKEQSPYEGAMDTLNGKTCLGRVYNVDEESRLCQVKTIGSEAYGTDDLDLQFVKCQHFAWHPDGDFATALPRIGTYVLVTFINSEPIITGVYPLSNTFGAGGRSNQLTLQAGDYGWQGVAGNTFVIRACGTIEASATLGCYTWWLPTNDTITSVCQNYELDPAGGYMHWTVDPKTADTVLDLKFFDNTAVTNVGRLQLGTTSSGALVSLDIGPPDENLNITQDTFSLQIQADGTTTVNIGNGNVVLTITPAGAVSLQTASDVSVDAKGKVAITSTGDTSVEAQGDVNVTTAGDANVTASGNLVAQAAQIEFNGSAGMVLTTETDPVVDNITGVPTMGVQTVLAGQ